MGITDKFDELKEKAVQAAGGADKVNEEVDQVAEKVDRTTGSKASKQIHEAALKLKQGIEKKN
jgi:hypothetical protein